MLASCAWVMADITPPNIVNMLSIISTLKFERPKETAWN
jgi:hypothetical protein